MRSQITCRYTYQMSAMITEKCPHPGCKFSASYPRLITVRAVIGKHRKKAHGYQSPGQKYYSAHMAKLKARKLLLRSRNSEVTFGTQTEPANSHNTMATGYDHSKQRPKRVVHDLKVTLCPVCGCDIEAVQVAINLRRGK
jgi:hypothetical protein